MSCVKVSAERDPVMEALRGDFFLKLDLYNFEEPKYEESKYVLTSPRSLEACSRVGVKPLGLLYKPLAQFQEELLPEDVPLRTIYNLYDEHEQDRQRKVRRCREERRKIIADEDADNQRSVTIGREAQPDADKIHTDGTVQRERTKWVSSIGHQRVSKDELNQRAKELHDRCVRLSQKVIACKNAVHGTATKKTGKLRSKKSPRASSRCNDSASRGSDKSSEALDSTLRLSQLEKSSLSQARPIRNPKLRQKLKGSRALGAQISLRDQKILELMMMKGEEAESHYEERNEAVLQWDEQRKRETAAREIRENRRRRMLAAQRQQCHRNKEAKSREREEMDETVRADRETRIHRHHNKWESAMEQQARMKQQQLEGKKARESHRKQVQEHNLQVTNEDEEEMNGLVTDKQRQDLSEALRRKEERLLQDTMRRKLENDQKWRAHEARKGYIENDKTIGLENVRMSIEVKHAQAATKYDEILKQRDAELQISQLEREKKQEVAKLSQRQQDGEMEEWRKSLQHYRKFAEERASDILNRTTTQKVRKAAEGRKHKEQIQKLNIKKVAGEVEAWRQSTQINLEHKDRKVHLLLDNKDSIIQQTRAMAQASENMRDELRKKYAADSFDKKLFKAELYNKLELGKTLRKCPAKNKSSVKIAYM